MDCSLPGSSIHGIFQAKVLEWVAIAFSKASYSFLWASLFCVCIFMCNKYLYYYPLIITYPLLTCNIEYENLTQFHAVSIQTYLSSLSTAPHILSIVIVFPVVRLCSAHSSCTCLENPMDKGAWQATVHMAAKNWVQLSYYTSSYIL